MKNLDSTIGVASHDLASLKVHDRAILGGCEEFAIIGFWSFDD